MVGMGLSTQPIYVNVRVGSFAAYLIKADAPVCLLFFNPLADRRCPLRVTLSDSLARSKQHHESTLMNAHD